MNYAEVAAAAGRGLPLRRMARRPKRKGIEVSLAQRKAKAGYVSPYRIARFYADLGDKDHAFEWLNTAYQEHDFFLMALCGPTSYSIPCTPIRVTPNWCAKSASRLM